MEEVILGREEIEGWIQRRRSQWIRMAYRILRDHDEAEDVVQETLVAVLRQQPNVRQLDAYMSRAVDWNAVKRRARLRRTVSLDTLPETYRENRLDALEVEQAVAGLPPAQQTIIRSRRRKRAQKSGDGDRRPHREEVRISLVSVADDAVQPHGAEADQNHGLTL